MYIFLYPSIDIIKKICLDKIFCDKNYLIKDTSLGYIYLQTHVLSFKVKNTAVFLSDNNVQFNCLIHDSVHWCFVTAPPHEHHVIALHKHGHHFGGLPLIFWISLAFLVIVFHLFLVKLIVNEYCQGQERFTGRRKGYNVWSVSMVLGSDTTCDLCQGHRKWYQCIVFHGLLWRERNFRN